MGEYLAPAAISAAPAFLSMFSPGPHMPGAPPMIKLPDRSSYQNSILESGFNPMSELYRIARESAGAKLNQELINRGLGQSSVGNQMMMAQQSDLANKFLENELQRRLQAFQAATGYDIAGANLQVGQQQQAYQAAMDRYNAEKTNQQGFWGTLNQVAGIGANAYMNNNLQKRYDANQTLQNQRWDQLMRMNPTTNAVQRYDSGGYYTAPMSPMGDYNMPATMTG